MSELEQVLAFISSRENVDLYGYTSLVLYSDGSGHLERTVYEGKFEKKCFLTWDNLSQLRSQLQCR